MKAKQIYKRYKGHISSGKWLKRYLEKRTCRWCKDEQIKFSEMMVYGTSEHEQRLCGWDW